ncbi:CBS domain-containing protein [Kineobactrum sediminis]|uniref:CBS domain-containing protein n=1 Tax=Kineobactrum sediminis TaxID=1905677 RepID=A0A2N5Y2H0_9GAMM|nr:CBS domain-containing protein [Kineobactrum sediminis]PLW82586.1 CBS domain-containing protein [Kineobactrum sediminis]
MLVENAMVREVASCSPDSSLEEIASLMWNNDCGSVPILDDEQHPVGIVTDRDIAMGAGLMHKPLWEISAREIMGDKKIACCNTEDSVQSALALMEKNEVRRLPVVNQYGQLAGMLSMGDVISATSDSRARGKKAQPDQIDAAEVLDFLKHVSAHHESARSASVG